MAISSKDFSSFVSLSYFSNKSSKWEFYSNHPFMLILKVNLIGKRYINMIYSMTEIEARYQETDKMGVIYHGNYATWFEVAH